MGVALRRFQLLCQFGFLLAEILLRCIARAQTALKLGLCRLQFAYFRGLSGKLPPKICDHLVPLSNFCTRDLAVVAGIAQLFFKGGLSGTGLLLAWLWLGRSNDVSRPMRADTVSEETNRDNEQNSGGIEHPDIPPCGLARNWQDATGEMRRTASAIRTTI